MPHKFAPLRLLSLYIYCAKLGDPFPAKEKIPPSLYKHSKSFGLTTLTKTLFNLQMRVIFSLFVCAGSNVLCCLRPTRSAKEPGIITPPASTTLEPLERPIMQLASDLPLSVAATQIPGELPTTTDPVPARNSQKKTTQCQVCFPHVTVVRKSHDLKLSTDKVLWLTVSISTDLGSW